MLGIAMAMKDRLRSLRVAAGLTQQDLAVKAGLSVSVVAHIEVGRIPNPRLDTIRALAIALGCSVDALAFDEGERQGESITPPEEPKKRKGKK
jgi:transcriptional regulator with XRE-family HTH domain